MRTGLQRSALSSFRAGRPHSTTLVRMRILVTSQHLQTIRMLGHGEIPSGVNVDVPSLAERRGVGFKNTSTATITFRPGIEIEILASWLYNKLCDRPTTRLTINQSEVRISRDEIVRVIQEEITKEGRS